MSDPVKTEVDCDHIIYSDWLRQSVFVFTDFDRACEELSRLGSPSIVMGEAGAGYSDHPDGSAVFWMVFKTDNPRIATVVHEAVHVADYLCEFTGIPITPDNVEVRCYLTEWLVSEVLAYFNRDNQ
ncbi:hypothetical protein [Roseovarius sp. MMSF_3281]|uniref:hypothetical protein n=1 Tax=Roseovarius sp. MMSF_3281 TaxID=3046694 RepID=UPI00273E7669|nr:hypothetical protein [Roseovarius sp. MMSF_3281]